MKTLKIIAVALVLFAAAAAGAQTMGAAAGHDLDALWTAAQKAYDTAQEDAIILLDSRTTTVGDEGTVVTRVHQVVWIATSRGIRMYADLRVPWNSATSTFEVEKLRTWMDGRWWPDVEKISDTAVVETLPYAVAEADDYTTLRETMLLHDGVELPCIMETAYTIAVQGPPTAGADDVFVFPQADPVVRSEYVVRVPAGVDVKFESLNGAPGPVVTENGVKELAWTMDRAGALKQPVTGQPEAYEPAVVWTTWESWDVLLREFNAAVEAAAVVEEALADSVAVLTAGLPDDVDRLQAVLDFAERTVRPVHTDDRPWRLAPRSAQRIYETGYAHDLDRGVYLVALLNRLAGSDGPGPQVALAPAGPSRVATDLPRLADLEVLGVEPAPGFQRYVYAFDHGGLQDLDDRMPIRAKPLDLDPGTAAGGRGTGAFTVDLSLAPGEDEWTGSGLLTAGGIGFDAAGWWSSDRTIAAAIGAMIEGVLPDITVLDVQAAEGFGSLRARFTVGMPAPDFSEAGTCDVAVGPPAAGVLHGLPGDVRPGDPGRESPVLLPEDISQRVTLRFKLDGLRTVRLPAGTSITNQAGEFGIRAKQSQGWLTYERTLRLDMRPASWPDLRALLLEEADPANGIIVLEKAK